MEVLEPSVSIIATARISLKCVEETPVCVNSLDVHLDTHLNLAVCKVTNFTDYKFAPDIK